MFRAVPAERTREHTVPVAAARRRRLRADRARQLADLLRHQILAGGYPGGVLPPEDVLAAEYGAGRNTVRQALDLLRGERLVERRPGVGTVVVCEKYPHGLDRLQGLAETLHEHGRVTNELRTVGPVRAPAREDRPGRDRARAGGAARRRRSGRTGRRRGRAAGAAGGPARGSGAGSRSARALAVADPAVRAAALEALRALRLGGAALYAQSLADPDPEVRIHAVRALVSVDAVAELARAAEDPAREVRVAVAKGLAAVHSPAPAPLDPLLADADPLVRAAA
ncbi:GntR family transcriptional regulator [Streptomyces roseus]|uniref:GntR family transcriptional regulator n=1 Tax=Streptomyces roseus TaxID=66430 RepID=UPI0036B4C262